jgi:hypothetical protein
MMATSNVMRLLVEAMVEAYNRKDLHNAIRFSTVLRDVLNGTHKFTMTDLLSEDPPGLSDKDLGFLQFPDDNNDWLNAIGK